MINYVGLLLSITGNTASPIDIIDAYISYGFPESEILANILGIKKKKINKLKYIDPVAYESEITRNQSLMPFIIELLFQVPQYKEKARQFIHKINRPKLNLASLPFATSLKNISAEAWNGKLDPVIGREEEIKTIINIINSRRKRNPILIGDAGVGKTAIVEGLATLINAGQVPIPMLSKTILSVDAAEFIEGMNGGEKFQLFINFLSNNKDIILFIDEIHMLTNMRRASGLGLMEALKPYLSRGDIAVIGATTEDEFIKIEHDKALARRFQSVFIRETTEEETTNILYGLYPVYAKNHSITIPKEAIPLLSRASQKIVGYNPDKAITLMDRTMATLKVKNDGIPYDASSTDIIDFLSTEYKVRREFITTDEKSEYYSNTLIEKTKIYKDVAPNIMQGILHSRRGSKKHKVLSITTIVGGRLAALRLAKAIASTLDINDEFFYVNGFDFTTDISVSRIKGAAPGYIGYGDKNLFNRIKHRPVPIIFDAFNVIHPNPAEAFLDIFRTGALETTAGDVIVFKNCDIIITTQSNSVMGSFSRSTVNIDDTLGQITNVIVGARTLPYSEFTKICKKYNIDQDSYKSEIDSGITPEELEYIIKNKQEKSIIIQ